MILPLLNGVGLEVGVSSPLQTTTSVPWVLIVADVVDVLPSTITIEFIGAGVDTGADGDVVGDPEAPDVWRVYADPLTVNTPPGPTLTVLVTDAGVTVVVLVVVVARSDASPLMTIAEGARE